MNPRPNAIPVTDQGGQQAGALPAQGGAQQVLPRADGADQPDVEQVEALAQGIQEHGILLAGVVDLDAHEAAPAGVGQQLGDGGP